MACLFAARLSAAGLRVTLLGSWQQGIQALRQHGVRLVEAAGSAPGSQAVVHAYPVQAYEPAEAPLAVIKASYALVLVKSWQTARAARQLAPYLDDHGLALTLQNGLGNREILAETLGARRVALGVATLGARLLGPGMVQSAGQGVISLGAHPGLGPLTNMLQSAGFVIETATDAAALLWGKLVINAAINPLTALLGVANGELLNRQPARKLLQSAAREAAAVAVAQGIRLPYPDPVVAAESIARRTAENYSSMLQDVQRGGPTEIDAICGAIVSAGEQTGVPTPINRTLHLLVSALQTEKT